MSDKQHSVNENMIDVIGPQQDLEEMIESEETKDKKSRMKEVLNTTASSASSQYGTRIVVILLALQMVILAFMANTVWFTSDEAPLKHEASSRLVVYPYRQVHDDLRTQGYSAVSIETYHKNMITILNRKGYIVLSAGAVEGSIPAEWQAPLISIDEMNALAESQ
ncbi:hypothetical protein ACP3V5_17365 [Vibrio maritimus]